ncbi:MAG: HD domain-containing protein [bacterium]|nr:HD domain-containing protein [bacterium]
MKNILTKRLLNAIDLAVEVHGDMKRKGDGSPYITHPIAVFHLLTKWNASENTCIAGLLHDVLEDVPEDEKSAYRKRIQEEFGPDVLEIVEGVTEQDKSLPWKERKQHYLDHLKEASEASAIVSCADLTHNLFCLIEAYKEQGEEVWSRFNASKQRKVWFIENRVRILKEKLPEQYTEELHSNFADLNAPISP